MINPVQIIHNSPPKKLVCSSCFDDDDIKAFIRRMDGPRGCDFCARKTSPTCKIDVICEYIERCLKRYWGFAVDQLPYESAEGGYIGNTWTTFEILYEEVGLGLPNDHDERLFYALLNGITDETWCDYDWLRLDEDEALKTSWQRFCNTVKHNRRFFFHSVDKDNIDTYSAISLLNAIADISERAGLIVYIEAGKKFWRARPDIPKYKMASPNDFGPPPPEHALQSNRMNPPGIPLLYLASSATTALRETRSTNACVGQWKVERSLRILDLRRLPPVPGVFSRFRREHRLTMRFLHDFAKDIMEPVERDQRVHIDYLPSQVVTEFLRDFEFHDGKLEGIAYKSTVHPSGWNLAIFASNAELGLETTDANWPKKVKPWLTFTTHKRINYTF